MKLNGKRAGLALLVLVAAVLLGLFIWVEVRWDHRFVDVPSPTLRVSKEPSVIAHGEYLARGPAHCAGCHLTSFAEAQQANGAEHVRLQGGTAFPTPLGTLYSKNLTPDDQTGIGRYPDALIFRLMRHSVKPDGTATLAPLMPFQMMADDDLVAAVSFLRSLPAVHHDVPPPEYNLLGKVMRTFSPIFRPVVDQNAPVHAPAEAPTVERGEYLARSVANCVGCHTHFDLPSGRTVGPEFGGGMTFPPGPDGSPGSDGKTWFRSPNLTRSGSLKFFPNKDLWIARFRSNSRLPGTPMYWGPFSRMSDADLEALWLFFRSLPPVSHDEGGPMFIPN